MSYSLFITRRFLANNASPISQQEWASIVTNMPDMVCTSKLKARNHDNDTIEIDLNDYIRWGYNDNTFYIRLLNGELEVSDPSDKAILKMHLLARALQAEVRGEDDELYEVPQEIIELSNEYRKEKRESSLIYQINQLAEQYSTFVVLCLISVILLVVILFHISR
ncbi:hypothetical protein CWB73_13730 [Pseudoalteromonas phenolica]|uniref:Uncharacterized protein n=1 Tax=Pseudoalteromonas phenolica TaxID=161398 RepID=A0A5S3YRE3_9GAMM|nr:hypothetical protein [Pseudoalteromonas phenolica]TMP79479.1 hypothetical protein CWB73_13730 [Pseudoalteromonas phenolica]